MAKESENENGDSVVEAEQAAPPAQTSERDLEARKAERRQWLVFGGCLSLVGAILLPNFIRARAQGSGTACKSNLKNIGTALEMYSSDWSGKYPSSLTVLTPKYLKAFPECPPAGEFTYRARFGPNAPFNPDHYEDYYYVECYGENHTPISITGNYPAYNGIQGLIERMP